MSILILSAQIHDHLLMLGPNVLQALGTHGFKAIPIKPPWPLLGDCSSAWVGQIHVKHTESACPCRNKFLQNSGILQPLQPFNGWLCRTKSCHAKKKKKKHTRLPWSMRTTWVTGHSLPVVVQGLVCKTFGKEQGNSKWFSHWNPLYLQL